MGKLSKLADGIKAIHQHLDISDADLLKSRSLGYNNVSDYDVPQRSFYDDYPRASQDSGQMLTETIDGDPITARYVAGRREVGGGDVSVTGRNRENLARAQGITIKEGSLGKWAGEIRGARGPNPTITTSNKLNEIQSESVFGHEYGHYLDEVTAGLDTKGIRKDLEEIYNIQNNDFYKPGQPKKKYALPDYDVDQELAAEAYKLYLDNPNFIKAKYPKVAEKLRKSVNTNHKLKNFIQLNSFGAGLAGLATLYTPEQNQAYADQLIAAGRTDLLPDYGSITNINNNPEQSSIQKAGNWMQQNLNTQFGNPVEGIANYMQHFGDISTPKERAGRAFGAALDLL